MPNLYDPAQVSRLIDDIGTLEGALNEHREAVMAADRRSRRARATAFFGTIVAACGLVAAIFALWAFHRADQRADVAERDRTERTVSACAQFNAQRLEIREAFKRSLVALVPPGVALSADQEAVLARYSAEVDARLPYRDCTPAGLEAYFSRPPVDPAK